jgi:Flp pilus assembly CpaE family ATPase
VDLPTAWDLVTLRALHACDLMLIAATPDVPALTHARRKLELLERFGAPVEAVRVVLNRAGSSAAFGAREVREGLGRDVDACLPADDAVMASCVNEGKLLEHVQPAGKLHRALESLADQAWIWAGGDAPVRSAPTLLRRLRHYVAGS